MCYQSLNQNIDAIDMCSKILSFDQIKNYAQLDENICIIEKVFYLRA